MSFADLILSALMSLNALDTEEEFMKVYQWYLVKFFIVLVIV